MYDDEYWDALRERQRAEEREMERLQYEAMMAYEEDRYWFRRELLERFVVGVL